tara:strand:+ start:41 stop:1243 length:1203 start_codon:yes stop_codon:yes gene_type:complete
MSDILFFFIGIVFIFLVLNFFSTYYLNWYYKKNFKSEFLTNHEYKNNIKSLLHGLSDDNILDLKRIFSSKKTKFGRFRMTYSPFTEHRDVEFHSPFLNINSEGFRNTKNPPTSKNENLIALFGGSTAFGYGVPDSMTLASYLEDQLKNENMPTLNIARQSYFSTLEVIALQNLLLKNKRFHSVIFLDGLNDVHHNVPDVRNKSRFSESIQKFWPEIDYIYGYEDESLSTKHFLLLTKSFYKYLPLVRFLSLQTDRVQRKLISSNKQRHVEHWQRGVNLDNLNVKDLASKIAELTQNNWDIARSICKTFKINPMFVLQPVYYVNFPIEKHLFLPKKENPFWKQIYTEYYNIMKSKNINNKDFLDASSVFQNPEECPFIDSHHYSPYGNQKIAKLIANKLNV